jgi:hypothetical protein
MHQVPKMVGGGKKSRRDEPEMASMAMVGEV